MDKRHASLFRLLVRLPLIGRNWMDRLPIDQLVPNRRRNYQLARLEQDGIISRVMQYERAAPLVVVGKKRWRSSVVWGLKSDHV